MARPGLLTHRKFIRLARLIRSDALAYGHLGIIWDACYEAGDDNVGSAEDLEYLARWQGEAGKLSSALVESGFIDEDNGTHRVHDLYDHAPDYVQKRMEREHQRRAKGVTISELRAKAGRASGEARRKQTASSDEQTGTNGEYVLNTCRTSDEQTGTNEATPAPSARTQHPAQEEKKEPTVLSTGTNGKMSPVEFFDRWNRWAAKHGFPTARKLTDDRRIKIGHRLSKDGWFEEFTQALEKLPIPGDGWQPDLDWLIHNSVNVNKILEGKYDWRAKMGGNGSLPLLDKPVSRVANQEDARNWTP